MRVTPQASRCRRSRSNSSGNAESSAITLTGRPRSASAAPTASLLPTWPATTIIGRPLARQRATISSTPAGSTAATSSARGRDGSRISSTM